MKIEMNISIWEMFLIINIVGYRTEQNRGVGNYYNN